MKVFFAVDGSHESLVAVRQVSQFLSAKTDAAAFYFAPPDIVLHHSTTATAMRETALRAITGGIFREARTFLPEFLALGVKEIEAQHKPREGILIEAEKWGADLIVVGARGMSRFDKVLLGSVSRAVVHHSRTPVFVARPDVERRGVRPLRILFAFDGSASSQAALVAAQQLTYPDDAEIIAVTAVDSPPAELPEWIAHVGPSAETLAMIEVWQREIEKDKTEARNRMSEFMGRQKPPFNRAEIVVVEGHAAKHILSLAESRSVDLVILGSQGKGPVKRLLIGSTSDKVLTHAHCSVLIARGV